MLNPSLSREGIAEEINTQCDRHLRIGAGNGAVLKDAHLAFKSAKTALAISASRGECAPGLHSRTEDLADTEKRFWSRSGIEEALRRDAESVFGGVDREAYYGTPLIWEFDSFAKEMIRNAVIHGKEGEKVTCIIEMGTKGMAIRIQNQLDPGSPRFDIEAMSNVARNVNRSYGLQFGSEKGYRHFWDKLATTFMRPMSREQLWSPYNATAGNSRGMGFTNMARTTLHEAWLDIDDNDTLEIYCMATKERVERELARRPAWKVAKD